MRLRIDPGSNPPELSPLDPGAEPVRRPNRWATVSITFAVLTWGVAVLAAMGVVRGIGAGVVVLGVCAIVGLVSGLVGLFAATADPEQKGSSRALWGIILSCPPIGIALMLWEFVQKTFP